MATTHDQSTYPSVKSFPIFTTVSGSIVHTTSPLFTGRMLAICVPALPAGCGPLKINDSEKLVSIKFSLRHPICTVPAVSLDRTSTPLLKHPSLLSINKVCEGASGEESKVDMKMSRGAASVDGTIPYGRCLKKAHKPDSNREALMSASFSALNLMWSCWLSASIFSASILRLAPLTMLEIVPLTGETTRISGLFLSWKTASPAVTWSPSFSKVWERVRRSRQVR